MTFSKILLTSALALTLAACASTPETESAAKTSMAKAEAPAGASMTTLPAKEETAPAPMKEETKSKDDKKSSKKGLSITYPVSTADAKAAAMSAMKEYGFKVKKESDTMIEAKRSSKVGVMVGSGGEKMYVTLTPVSDISTDVNVRTKKTFVGLAGQKNWDDEVHASIAAAIK